MLWAMALAVNLTKKSIRFLTLWVCLMLTGNLIAQTYFNKRIDLTTVNRVDRLNSILQVSDGYVMTGITRNASDIKTLLLAKMDTAGNTIWTKLYGDSTIDETYGYPGCLIKFGDDKYLSASCWRIYTSGKQINELKTKDYSLNPTTYEFNSGSSDTDPWVFDRGRLICYNNSFDTLWSKYYGDLTLPHDTAFLFYNLTKTNNNCIAFTGILYTQVSPPCIILLKTDSLGNKLWLNCYGFTNNDIYQGFSVIQTTDGGYAIGGHKYAPGEFGDPLVIKTDSLGNQQWMLNFGGQYEDNKAMVCPAHDGTIICGTVLATGMVSPDMAWARINISKITNDGNVLWNKLYGADRMDNFLLNIRPTPDSGFIACGQVVNEFPHYVGWLLKINRNGDSLWYREYNFLLGEYGMHQLDDVIATSDKGYFSSGCLTPLFLPDTGSVDTWLVKVDSLGCEAPGECWVGINETAPPEPLTVAEGELSIRPNPASGYFTAQLSQLPTPNTNLSLTDLTGRCLRQWPLTGQTTSFDCSGLPPGVYFVSVKDGNGRTQTQKLIIQ